VLGERRTKLGHGARRVADHEEREREAAMEVGIVLVEGERRAPGRGGSAVILHRHEGRGEPRQRHRILGRHVVELAIEARRRRRIAAGVGLVGDIEQRRALRIAVHRTGRIRAAGAGRETERQRQGGDRGAGEAAGGAARARPLRIVMRERMRAHARIFSQGGLIKSLQNPRRAREKIQSGANIALISMKNSLVIETNAGVTNRAPRPGASRPRRARGRGRRFRARARWRRCPRPRGP